MLIEPTVEDAQLKPCRMQVMVRAEAQLGSVFKNPIHEIDAVVLPIAENPNRSPTVTDQCRYDAIWINLFTDKIVNYVFAPTKPAFI